jgi:hypothetical protein
MEQNIISKAPFTGTLEFGEIKIPCFVTDDGRRLISGRAITAAIGMKGRGQGVRRIVAHKTLKPFIPDELTLAIETPYLVLGTTSRKSNPTAGYEGAILHDLCQAVLDARDAGVLKTEQEKRYAVFCDALIRSFAKVGITALIDEATGYQEYRSKDELHKILEMYVAKELLPWAKRFPDEYYELLFKLKGWQYSPFSVKRPKIVGKITNELIYDRLPPGVKEELKKKNPVVSKKTWRRKATHHQLLTPEIGHPHLDKMIAGIIALMRASGTSWNVFKRLFERAYPKPDVTQCELPLHEADE